MCSFHDLELVCCSMSNSNCCFLSCIQISQEAAQVVWYSHFLKNFLQFVVIHTVKSIGIVNKVEIDVYFLEFSCFFDDPTDVGNLISGSFVFSKSSLNIWKFMVQVLLKPGLENFEHFFTNVWDECNCVVVWAFYGIAFLWDRWFCASWSPDRRALLPPGFQVGESKTAEVSGPIPLPGFPPVKSLYANGESGPSLH